MGDTNLYGIYSPVFNTENNYLVESQSFSRNLLFDKTNVLSFKYWLPYSVDVGISVMWYLKFSKYPELHINNCFVKDYCEKGIIFTS